MLLFLYDFIVYSILGYINQWYSINMTAPYGSVPLYDVGFIYLPKISSKYCDVVLVVLSLYFAFRWIFIDKLKVRNMLRIMSLVFIVRLCCFSSTTVPYPTSECNARVVGDPIIWNVLPYMWDNHTNSCYDLMFSGHAAHVTLVMLFTIIYSRSIFEKIVVSSCAIVCWFLIVASQIHYTHDVIVGITVSITMFGTYFSTMMCPFFNLKKKII